MILLSGATRARCDVALGRAAFVRDNADIHGRASVLPIPIFGKGLELGGDVDEIKRSSMLNGYLASWSGGSHESSCSRYLRGSRMPVR